MNWDDLRGLDALVRLGSVAAAARELQVSQSTLYRRVAALEASIGVRCLVRGAGGTELTEAGRALAAAAGRTREAITRVVGDVKGQDARVEGEVSLTTVDGMLPFLGAPLAALTARHPALTVSLHLGNSGPSVRRREVDVAIGIMARPPSDCWGRRLFRIRYGVFGVASAIAQEPQRWVVLGPAMAGTPEGQWETLHATNVAVVTPSRHGAIALVLAGAGISLLPRPLAALHPALIDLGGKGLDALERTAWVLTHESTRKMPRIAALTSVLIENLSQLK